MRFLNNQDNQNYSNETGVLGCDKCAFRPRGSSHPICTQMVGRGECTLMSIHTNKAFVVESSETPSVHGETTAPVQEFTMVSSKIEEAIASGSNALETYLNDVTKQEFIHDVNTLKAKYSNKNAIREAVQKLSEILNN